MSMNGMPLCPGMQRFIAVTAQFQDGASDDTIAGMRQRYLAFCRAHEPARATGIAADDIKIAGVPVRIYRRVPAASDPAPCVLYMHGGGWVLGSVDTHDGIASEIARRTAATVVSVDYRLAPEHSFPAGLADCRAVLDALALHSAVGGIDPSHIVVAGDSAGANLAAALTLSARDAGGPALRGQALIYPVLGTDFSLPSYIENAEAPMLQTEAMALYWRWYLGRAVSEGKPDDPLAAPLAASTHANLPPALIMTAGHDPVRDDGSAYAQKLRQSGVAVTYRCAADLPHGYLRARTMSPSAAAEVTALCEGISELLG